MRRRDALIAGGAVAVAMGVPAVLRRTRPLPLAPIPGLPGFQRVTSDFPISALAISSIGLDAPDPLVVALSEAVRRDPDAALGLVPWRSGDAPMPVAVYTDAFCPNCVRMERWLLPWVAADPGLSLSFRHLPLLGPASDRAARAALAGRAVGREEAVWHAVTGRVLRPSPAALRALAVEVGAAPGEFEAAYGSSDTTVALAQARAEASVLGVFGTPAVLAGRILVIGALSPRDLRRLVALQA